jgi:hypothetical protein
MCLFKTRKRLKQILANQDLIKSQLTRMEKTMTDIKGALTAYATKVDEFSNAASSAIKTVQQEIADLKSQLVDATTPEEVAAILEPAIAKLDPIKAALTALAAGGEPTVPEEPL